MGGHGWAFSCNVWVVVWHLFKQGLNHDNLPVVPHKKVAEVSQIGNYRRGELL